MAYRYKKIKLKDGTTQDEHRLIMEQYPGRKLNPNETVHHINNDGRDNRIENLKLTTLSKHAKEHMKKGDLFNINSIKRIRRKCFPDNQFQCSKCGKIKPKSEFRIDNKTFRGISPRCKMCLRIKDKIYNKFERIT